VGGAGEPRTPAGVLLQPLRMLLARGRAPLAPRDHESNLGLGAGGKLRGGGVGFWQYFGSALQVTPHLHVLVPEGVWTDGAQWVEVPAPDAADVERLLRRVVKGLAKDFAEVGESWPEDALDALRREGVQHRLPLEEQPRPQRPGRRVAVVEGFSLHADTWVHGHDRQGLERLCQYGSRGWRWSGSPGGRMGSTRIKRGGGRCWCSPRRPW
jgi:hypothetical protein